MLVARPAGVYFGPASQGFVWLIDAKTSTQNRHPRDVLANQSGWKQGSRPAPALTTKPVQEVQMAYPIIALGESVRKASRPSLRGVV